MEEEIPRTLQNQEVLEEFDDMSDEVLTIVGKLVKQIKYSKWLN